MRGLWKTNRRGLDKGFGYAKMEIGTMAKGSQPKTQRNKKIVEFRERGLSYYKLGRIFNLSPTTVREIYMREKKKGQVSENLKTHNKKIKNL